MTEKTKLEHVRNNKDTSIDYIKIYNQQLTKTDIKGLAQIRYADNMLLGQVIHSLAQSIKDLQEKIETLTNENLLLKDKVEQVDKVNREIIKGKLAL